MTAVYVIRKQQVEGSNPPGGSRVPALAHAASKDTMSAWNSDLSLGTTRNT